MQDVIIKWYQADVPHRINNAPDWNDNAAVMKALRETINVVNRGFFRQGAFISHLWHGDKWGDPEVRTPASFCEYLAQDHSIDLSTDDIKRCIYIYDTIAPFPEDLAKWIQRYSPAAAYKVARAIRSAINDDPLMLLTADDSEGVQKAEMMVRNIKNVLGSNPIAHTGIWKPLLDAGIPGIEQLRKDGGRDGPKPRKIPDTASETIAKSRNGMIDDIIFIPRHIPHPDVNFEKKMAREYAAECLRLGLSRDQLFFEMYKTYMRERDTAAWPKSA